MKVDGIGCDAGGREKAIDEREEMDEAKRGIF